MEVEVSVYRGDLILTDQAKLAEAVGIARIAKEKAVLCRTQLLLLSKPKKGDPKPVEEGAIVAVADLLDNLVAG